MQILNLALKAPILNPFQKMFMFQSSQQRLGCVVPHPLEFGIPGKLAMHYPPRDAPHHLHDARVPEIPLTASVRGLPNRWSLESRSTNTLLAKSVTVYSKRHKTETSNRSCEQPDCRTSSRSTPSTTARFEKR